MTYKTLVVITGPTAVGKTAAAIQISHELDTEIISADSRQFYREMNIGTAKPSREEMEKVPHHLIGHLSIHDYYNVSLFEQDVLAILDDLFKTKDHALLVGGSGLYIDAVCKGIDDLPDADPELRARLNEDFKRRGIESLREKLMELDPEYYREVDLANPKRLMRAIEVCLQTGKKYSELRKREKVGRGFNIIKIGLNLERQKLFEKINNRVDRMMEKGLLEEALALYPYKGLNALNTVGYKELFEYFDGRISLDQAVTDIKTNTRRYAKRQLTWFKKDKEIRWFLPMEFEDMLQRILSCD
ncbi:MAG: tRNA (adenosine(37)-N6)-dimethylallyltransferase MiaA [Bacteroidales bacterium]|nr:tRNA (adenosine(37)-N6)-dimethylallyltransferase MiaA [Bacteroidales bacterium]MCF8343730.1 tRNA (adenosine(37)-N6)-dimethylallyltransferase MiaA [Bacteroidales bacterium]MCF8349648.1 tRNA (adenosine(37)-N6)-dimethylallyltransferase MiaA [Bacteroidales bacterium]MCF8374894.1 tRNA (adenosine(37)-N6)-dimethylallyltransferase MiaA [Bacteroidales bacterium]MCF8400127.1 tRNA (adenosine(37)-N6)-dimethylallyltransferase MiaA [Bacteroidales bacterium]